MSNAKTAKKVAQLQPIHAAGTPIDANLDDISGIVETMRVARKNGLDLFVRVHVGAVTLDVSNEEAAVPAASREDGAVATPSPRVSRFFKVSKEGRVLPASAKEWEGVYDSDTGLIWGRALVTGGERTWAEALKAAAATTLCGAPARAPTIRERISITDFEKHSPALDTAFFAKESGWEWTSTPDAESPSDSAWGVTLGYGYASRGNQSARLHVRAVHAGQPLGL
jgi:hypothetical protein